MMWFFAILLVLALGGVALVASGQGTPLAQVYDDRPDVRVPSGRDLTGEDLRRLRLGVVVRGYRMAEVDALLDRLAGQLEEAEERARLANGPGDGTGPAA
jgi:DivIVA domain-containing protein